MPADPAFIYTYWASNIQVLLTLSSDYMYPLAMLKTTPLVVTVGISMTIPCAVIGDWTILGVTASGQKLIGATLVVASFIGLGIEGARSGKHHGLQSDGYERLDTRGDSNVENGEGLSASGGR
ncbi:hypothetical protein FRB98_005843 [Tulasnella sp. 332]|nr:hypothetical protein FRB98_005843 [Tulasnella sp. 332]